MTIKKSFSFIIPVYHEKNINKTIERISKYENCEIIVCDIKEADSINKITSPDIIKLTSKIGRANQMNEGAKIAKGEVLIFLHADTILPDDALESIHEVTTKAGAYDLGINNKRFIFRIIELFSSIRSRLTRIPYGDQTIFISRKLFEEIGGYEDLEIMEDVALMRKLKRRNEAITIINKKVLTSSRRWEKDGIIYTTLRNWVLISLYFLGVSPKKLIKYYQ